MHKKKDLRGNVLPLTEGRADELGLVHETLEAARVTQKV